MVTIMPLRGEALQREAAAQDGFVSDSEPTGWVVSERGVAKGYLLFDLSETCITRLSCADNPLADGLLKTAADFAFRAGIGQLVCTDNRPENRGALQAAGFIPDGAVWKIEPGRVFRDCQKNQ